MSATKKLHAGFFQRLAHRLARSSVGHQAGDASQWGKLEDRLRVELGTICKDRDHFRPLDHRAGNSGFQQIELHHSARTDCADCQDCVLGVGLIDLLDCQWSEIFPNSEISASKSSGSGFP